MASGLEFDIGTALLTQYDDDGFLGVQIDGLGGEQSGIPPYEVHSPHGLLTRAHDPSDDGGCQVLFGMEAGRGHAWFCSDPRVVPLLPPLEKGGAVLYGGKIKAPTFFSIDGRTNSTTLYVPYKVDDDGVAEKAMSFSINVDNEGEESIEITHGSGASFYMMESGGAVSIVMKNSAGDSYIEVNDQGIVLNGSVTVQGGFNAGGPEGAQNLALGPPLIQVLQQMIQIATSDNAVLRQLINVVAAINAVTTGAPAAGLASLVGDSASSLSGALSAILAPNTKGA